MDVNWNLTGWQGANSSLIYIITFSHSALYIFYSMLFLYMFSLNIYGLTLCLLFFSTSDISILM